MTLHVYHNDIYIASLETFFESEADCVEECDECSGDFCYCEQPIEFIECEDYPLLHGAQFWTLNYTIEYYGSRYAIYQGWTVTTTDEDRSIYEGALPDRLLRVYLVPIEEYDDGE